MTGIRRTYVVKSSMQDIPYDVSHVPIDYENDVTVKEVSCKIIRKHEKQEREEQRVALEMEVARLQKMLKEEVHVRHALNRGLSRPLRSLPRIYANLPLETRELLLEVAVLEEEIVSLEKQVLHLGREVENESPPADKKTIYHTPSPIQSPLKPEVIPSPSVSPSQSARNVSKPCASSGKSIDDKSNLSKPLFPAGKPTNTRRSPIKDSVSPGGATAIGSPISTISPKNLIKQRRITKVVAPHNSPVQRNIPAKVLQRNSRDLKSQSVSAAKPEPREVNFSAVHTMPFITTRSNSSKENEDCILSVSPAPLSQSDVSKGCPEPQPKTKMKDVKLQSTVRSKRTDPLNAKVAPLPRSLEPPSTGKRNGQDKDLLSAAMHTPRLSRQQLVNASKPTRQTTATTLTTSEQGMEYQRVAIAKTVKFIPLICEPSPKTDRQKTVDAEAVTADTNYVKIANTDEPNKEEYKSIQLSPDHVKVINPVTKPDRDPELDLKHVKDSILLSKEVVKLLETIYGKLQQKQPPLTSDSCSSSQASTSSSLSSTNPDDYEMKGSANIKIGLDDCYGETFRTKREASLNFMQDCYTGEVAGALHPYAYLSRENISNCSTFQHRLLSYNDVLLPSRHDGSFTTCTRLSPHE